jgi:5-methylthioadenosine/S-adenosylhomocysteine deaminase
VRPQQTILEHHAVRLRGDRIDAVLPREEALEAYPDDRRVSLDRHVLLPGLVNMHTHSPMTLLRGFADDLPLEDWLRQHIWPAEGRFVSREFVRDGVRLAMAEMLRCGTTCFNEMYFFPEEIAETARRAGMRATVGVPVIDVPTPWANGIDECLNLAREFVEAMASEPLISPSLAPHAPYTVDDAGLARVAALASQHGIKVGMHLLEASWERRQSIAEHGTDPLRRLDALGLLSDGLQAVHMVHLEPPDLKLLAERGVHCIHCPESNLKLGNGVSPVRELLAAGVNVSIGTDGAASNNNLDLLEELRCAALLAKGVTGDPEALDAWQAIEMATLAGARALGLDQVIGSVEVGKQADLAALDLEAPETRPLHHLHSQLVYAASGRQFTDVWVAGRRLLHAGELTTLDLGEILATADAWARRMAI